MLVQGKGRDRVKKGKKRNESHKQKKTKGAREKKPAFRLKAAHSNRRAPPRRSARCPAHSGPARVRGCDEPTLPRPTTHDTRHTTQHTHTYNQPTSQQQKGEMRERENNRNATKRRDEKHVIVLVAWWRGELLVLPM